MRFSIILQILGVVWSSLALIVTIAFVAGGHWETWKKIKLAYEQDDFARNSDLDQLKKNALTDNTRVYIEMDEGFLFAREEPNPEFDVRVEKSPTSWTLRRPD